MRLRKNYKQINSQTAKATTWSRKNVRQNLASSVCVNMWHMDECGGSVCTCIQIDFAYQHKISLHWYESPHSDLCLSVSALNSVRLCFSISQIWGREVVRLFFSRSKWIGAIVHLAICWIEYINCDAVSVPAVHRASIIICSYVPNNRFRLHNHNSWQTGDIFYYSIIIISWLWFALLQVCAASSIAHTHTVWKEAISEVR